MNNQPSLSLQNLELLESVCEKFESADSGDNRDIERLIEGVEEPARSYFIRELVALDMELRQRCGEKVRAADYDSFSSATDAETAKNAFVHLQPELADVSEAANTQLPERFQMIKEVGRGGIGSVWQVFDQTSQRTLAIKMLRRNLRNDRQANIRLEREALVTGSLQHPGIPPVHDFGTMSDGSVYFAMKLVDGQTFEEILNGRAVGENELTRMLGVFEQVAQTLAYTHSQNVIHRDIKPQNIMVGQFAEVQVMDWGMAKRLNGSVVAESGSVVAESDQQFPNSDAGFLFGDGKRDTISKTTDSSIGPNPGLTQAGDVLGTPSYMAPEQARGEINHLDSRTDVFSLGAILFEILTGSRLFDETSAATVLQKVSTGDIETSLARLNETDVATELKQLCRRCIAFQPNDRPDDAGEVAAAIGRYFADAQERVKQAAVELRAAEVRASEESKRRKTQMWMMSAVLGALAIGLAGVSWQWSIAQRAKNNYKNGLKVFTDSFQSVDPKTGSNSTMTAKDVLLKAERSLEKSDLDDAGRMELYQNLSRSFVAIGEYVAGISAAENALELVKAQLGENAPEALLVTHDLAIAYKAAGRNDEALPLFEKVLEHHQVIFGDDHRETLVVMNNLARAYESKGRLDDALELKERTYELFKTEFGEDHPDTFGPLNNLARSYELAGRLGDAIPLYEKILEQMKSNFGEDHPNTLATMNNLAAAYDNNGELDQAFPLKKETLQLCKIKFGPEHPNTLKVMNGLGVSYQKAGQIEHALPLYEEAFDIAKAELGDDHPDTLFYMGNLAGAYEQTDRVDEAILQREQLVEMSQAKLGDEHHDTLHFMNDLANAYQLAERLDDSIELFERTLESRKSTLGNNHPQTLNTMNDLAFAYDRADQPKEAKRVLEDLLSKRAAATNQSWTKFDTLSHYGGVLLQLGDVKEAAKHLVDGYQGLVEKADTIIPRHRNERIARALNRLIKLAEAQNDSTAKTKWQQAADKLDSDAASEIGIETQQ